MLEVITLEEDRTLENQQNNKCLKSLHEYLKNGNLKSTNHGRPKKLNYGSTSFFGGQY